MRYSKQRETILEILKGTTNHPTAEWVYDRAREKMPNISLGTVYRNLTQLDEAGSISKILDDGRVRYDGNLDPHDHFRCLHCERIYDFQAAGLNLSLEEIQNRVIPEAPFVVTQINLELLGICNYCQTDEQMGDSRHGS